MAYLRQVTSAVGALLVRAWRQQTEGESAKIYDEVLYTVAARAVAEGSLGKAEIGALVVWKRITAQTRWASLLMFRPDSVVRAITRVAFDHANDTSSSIPQAGQAARSALWDLPGMRGTGALASAVLLALAPARMAVWDRRAATTLTALGMHPRSGAGFYGRYLATTLDLTALMEAVDATIRVTPRDVDLALFHVAGSQEMLCEAARAR